MNKSKVIFEGVFISDHCSTIVEHPCEEPFDLPPFAVSAQLAPVLCGLPLPVAAVRTDEFHTPLFQGASESVAVICPVSYQPFHLDLC